ncbi:MAG: hypothetical protein CMJ58_09900 [Planctomycetaceae bacterium]|nr:hypothetical protein [Planctomycetaceae bacterium]
MPLAPATFRSLSFVAALLLWNVCSGCSSSNNAQVSGSVARADGTPLVRARVTAHPQADGATVYGTSDSQGRFRLSTGDPTTGVPPGDYRVSVAEDIGDMEQPQPPTVAAKYSSPANSGFSFSVAAGEDHELDLILDPP